MESIDFRNPFAGQASSSSSSDGNLQQSPFTRNPSHQWRQDVFANFNTGGASATDPVAQQRYNNFTKPATPGPSFTTNTTGAPPLAPPAQETHPDPQPQQEVPQFDIFEWYPKYQSCQTYFTAHAQSSLQVQALAAFINIHLPFQRPLPISPPTPARPSPGPSSSLPRPPRPPQNQSPTSVSLIPYLRRLVVTGLDFPGILHGFFGDDWISGIGPLHEQERRNYLFAAKSGGWASVKRDYDMLPLEMVPFMRPLQGVAVAEIEAAEKSWSEWLAMEDWMVGPRAPETLGDDDAGGGGRGGGKGRESVGR